MAGVCCWLPVLPSLTLGEDINVGVGESVMRTVDLILPLTDPLVLALSPLLLPTTTTIVLLTPVFVGAGCDIGLIPECLFEADEVLFEPWKLCEEFKLVIVVDSDGLFIKGMIVFVGEEAAIFSDDDLEGAEGNIVVLTFPIVVVMLVIFADGLGLTMFPVSVLMLTEPLGVELG